MHEVYLQVMRYIYSLLCCDIEQVGSGSNTLNCTRNESGLYLCQVTDQPNLEFSMVCLGLLQWSRGSVLAFGTQVHGFTPGQSYRIFRVKKSSERLPSEGK